jgi:hypothetical protein
MKITKLNNIGDLPKYKKYFIKFVTQTEYLIEIKDYTSDDLVIQNFISGKYDEENATPNSKPVVQSIRVETVYTSEE